MTNARALRIHFAALIFCCASAVFFLRAARAAARNPDDTPNGDDGKRAALETRAASNDAKQSALALYELAELDDHDFEFALALAHYEASIARDPSHRYALRAHAHADTLRAHSEGDFAPYRELEKIRRDRSAARDPLALATLAKDADEFPPGLVRVEARMLAGDALIAQGDSARGLPLLELVDLDPKADPILHHQAAHELVDAYLARADAASALAIASRPKEDPALLKKVKIWVRRQKLRSVSLAILALFAMASTFAIARAVVRGRRSEVAGALGGFAPIGIAFAMWIGLFGGILAGSYERGNQAPFFALALAAAPIFLVARAWGAAGSGSRAARIGRAVFSAASVAAAAFVVLMYVGGGVYLAGFGL